MINDQGFRPARRAGHCPKPVPGAALRVFVFHHAGGSHLPYREWPAHFPPDWEVHLLDAPGRGRLSDMPVCRSIEELVRFFKDEIVLAMDGRPFAFFGHSMGGLAAYELTNVLAAEGLPLPVWLGLSARGAPRAGGEEVQRHALPDDELRRHLVAMGGTPVEVIEDEELWQTFSGVIRGDLRLVETWQPRPGTGRLQVPLSVFGGTRDVVVPPERLGAWAEFADALSGPHLFDGGHFYFQGRVAAVADRMTRDIREALRAARTERDAETTRR